MTAAIVKRLRDRQEREEKRARLAMAAFEGTPLPESRPALLRVAEQHTAAANVLREEADAIEREEAALCQVCKRPGCEGTHRKPDPPGLVGPYGAPIERESRGEVGLPVLRTCGQCADCDPPSHIGQHDERPAYCVHPDAIAPHDNAATRVDRNAAPPSWCPLRRKETTLDVQRSVNPCGLTTTECQRRGGCEGHLCDVTKDREP